MQTETQTDAPVDEATIKVRALRTGYYAHTLMRGDDTLGEGNGNVFVLEPREVSDYDVRGGRCIVDRATGKVKMLHLSAEQQFSPLWMERVSDDEEERYTFAQDALNHETDGVGKAKRRRK